MNLLPQASGARPRVACEITSQGVVAGRSTEPAAALSAVAKVELRDGAVVPGLKPGNVADRVALIAAVRKVMEGVGLRPNARGADLTLILPDAAVRVLLLEFEALPNKLSEALPLVRFRLKKLLPFEADDAMVTFQIMSHSRSLVRVLAVATPRDVLAEYETAVREAGFEPGAVLPSTLAALAGLSDTEPAALLVNANRLGITTAIVREGVLLLHRSVDLQDHGPITPAGLPSALFQGSDAVDTVTRVNMFNALPLVSVEETEAEWAAQEALPEHGRNPYADRARDEEAVQNEDGITGLPVPAVYGGSADGDAYDSYVSRASVPSSRAADPGALANSAYAGTTVLADLEAEKHNSEFYAPTSPGTMTEDQSGLLLSLRDGSTATSANGNGAYSIEPLPPAGENGIGSTKGRSAHQQDLAEAVSVAAAYFEDTLSTAPHRVLSAGPLGAEALRRALESSGVGGEDGLTVKELTEPAALLADAASASVPRGWLAGVVGALRG